MILRALFFENSEEFEKNPFSDGLLVLCVRSIFEEKLSILLLSFHNTQLLPKKYNHARTTIYTGKYRAR